MTGVQTCALPISPGTPVLSLQNGIGQAERAAAVAPALHWLTGMVPFNIAERGPGHLHRGSGGHLAAQDAPVLRIVGELDDVMVTVGRFHQEGLRAATHAAQRTAGENGHLSLV